MGDPGGTADFKGFWRMALCQRRAGDCGLWQCRRQNGCLWPGQAVLPDDDRNGDHRRGYPGNGSSETENQFQQTCGDGVKACPVLRNRKLVPLQRGAGRKSEGGGSQLLQQEPFQTAGCEKDPGIAKMDIRGGGRGSGRGGDCGGADLYRGH